MLAFHLISLTVFTTFFQITLPLLPSLFWVLSFSFVFSVILCWHFSVLHQTSLTSLSFFVTSSFFHLVHFRFINWSSLSLLSLVLSAQFRFFQAPHALSNTILLVKCLEMLSYSSDLDSSRDLQKATRSLYHFQASLGLIKYAPRRKKNTSLLKLVIHCHFPPIGQYFFKLQLIACTFLAFLSSFSWSLRVFWAISPQYQASMHIRSKLLTSV